MTEKGRQFFIRRANGRDGSSSVPILKGDQVRDAVREFGERLKEAFGIRTNFDKYRELLVLSIEGDNSNVEEADQMILRKKRLFEKLSPEEQKIALQDELIMIARKKGSVKSSRQVYSSVRSSGGDEDEWESYQHLLNVDSSQLGSSSSSSAANKTDAWKVHESDKDLGQSSSSSSSGKFINGISVDADGWQIPDKAMLGKTRSLSDKSIHNESGWSANEGSVGVDNSDKKNKNPVGTDSQNKSLRSSLFSK